LTSPLQLSLKDKEHECALFKFVEYIKNKHNEIEKIARLYHPDLELMQEISPRTIYAGYNYNFELKTIGELEIHKIENVHGFRIYFSRIELFLKDDTTTCPALSPAVIEQLRPELEQLIDRRKKQADYYNDIIKDVRDKANEYLERWLVLEEI
jgi:hypothetical protein